jgi:DNA-binding CsgD family transcriptional regulator/PAS domain-containing protein
MLSAAVFSELVGAIYDCALDPGLWPGALASLRSQLRFHNASLSVYDFASSSMPIHVLNGVEEPWLSRIELYGEEVLDQWGGVAGVERYEVGEPYVLTRTNPAAATRQNRYFAEWAEPQGLIDTMAAILARDAAGIGNIAFGRHRDEGPITDDEVDGVRLVLPHIRRAVAISRTLEIKQVTAATFEAVVQKLSAAVLLVDAAGRLVYANAAGEAQLRPADPLELRSGRIACRATAGQKALVAALAALDGSSNARKGFDIPLRGQEGRIFALHVLPLGVGGIRAAMAPNAAAAIFVTPRIPRREPRGRLFAEVFGLTPAEIRVFELAAAGLPPNAMARTLGVGVSTVRTHLLRLFDKTGVRRQAELAALAASFEAPVNPD